MMFHKSTHLFDVDHTIQPGNWGRLVCGIGTSHRHYHLYKEAILEWIKCAEFQDRPSRLNCTYAFEDRASAEGFANRSHLPEHIYRVDLTDSSAQRHALDMGWIDDMDECHTVDEIKHHASQYWAGHRIDVKNKSLMEMLIPGSLVVRERVGVVKKPPLTD
jgi:hypothetical protein